MTVLIPLAEDEGFQLIILRSSAARILSKRVQVSQRIWVDVVADHARWEYVWSNLSWYVAPEARPIIEWRMITR